MAGADLGRSRFSRDSCDDRARRETPARMGEHEPTYADQDFAAHSAWVRRLARGLLDDAGDADDLAQEAWIVLQRQPAGAVADLRAWLAGVVRTIARRTRERDRSRLASLRAETRERLAPSTAEVLETESVRRAVVDAVLGLDDPYRSTLLLHYYEELAPHEIARRLGVPGSTVRARLQRGLARVRAKLGERDPRGDARASLLALAGGSASPSAALGKGVLVMQATKLTVAAAVCALIAFGVWHWTDGRTGPAVGDALVSSAGSDGHGENESSLERLPAVAGGVEASRSSAASAPAKVADGLWHLRIARSIGSVGGTVVRNDDGAPVQGAVVHLTTDVGYVAHRAELAEDRVPIERTVLTDARGAFEVDDVPTGSYRLDISAAPDLAAEQVVDATTNGRRVLVRLLPASERRNRIASLVARVVDDAGSRVPGVEVRFAWSNVRGAQGDRVLTTDARGEVVFTGDQFVEGRLDGTTIDRIARVDVQAGSDSVHNGWFRDPERDSRGPVYELVLSPPATLTGVVRDGAGLQVEAWWRGPTSRGARPSSAAKAICAPDGSFAFERLAPGLHLITVEATRPLLRADLPYLDLLSRSGPPFPRYVRLEAGKSLAVELALVPAADVDGRAVDDAGAPVAGATVRAWIQRSQSPAGPLHHGETRWVTNHRDRFADWPAMERIETRTDAEGRYVLHGLSAAEPWALEIQMPGLTRSVVDRLTLRDGETTRLEHRMRAAGALQVSAWRWAVIGVYPEGGDRPAAIVVAPDAPATSITITGLATGRHRLRSLHWVEDVSTDLGVVEIRAGETSCVDVRDRAPHVRSVRIECGGSPVFGASVCVVSPADQFLEATSDADGRFVLRYPFPATEPGAIEIHAQVGVDTVRTRVEVAGLLDGTPGPDVVVSLPETAVTVEVRDADGRPIEGTVACVPATVSTSPWPSRPSVRRSIDANGRARFGLLPPGEARITVETADGWAFPAKTVTFVEREHPTVVLQAPPTGALTVTVLDARGARLAGSRVALDGREENGQRALAKWRTTNERGEVEFPRVPTGSVRVVATFEGPGVVPQRAGGADTQIVADSGNSVSVTIAD